MNLDYCFDLQFSAADHIHGKLLQPGVQVIDAVTPDSRRLNLVLKGNEALQAQHGMAVIGGHIENLNLHGSFHQDSFFRNSTVVYLDLPAAVAELEN